MPQTGNPSSSLLSSSVPEPESGGRVASPPASVGVEVAVAVWATVAEADADGDELGDGTALGLAPGLPGGPGVGLGGVWVSPEEGVPDGVGVNVGIGAGEAFPKTMSICRGPGSQLIV
jgi:hypothetical protein